MIHIHNMPYTISVGQWMIPQLKENNENSFLKKI